MKIDKTYLTEDTLDKLNAMDDNVFELPAGGDADVFEALDDAYALAQEKLADYLSTEDWQDDHPAVILHGHAGVGKTAIIKRWCRDRGIRLVQEQAQHMEASDLGGALSPDRETGKTAVKLRTTQFDKFKDPNRPAVMFLDELNRAPGPVRGALLTLINNHVISDPESDVSVSYLPGLLFVVSAVNPVGKGYVGTERLDPAELGRFRNLRMVANPIDSLNYFNNQFFPKRMKKAKELGRADQIEALPVAKEIVTLILTDPSFSFDGDEEINAAAKRQVPSLNPRSLEKTVDAWLHSKNRTKDYFIKVFAQQCGPHKVGLIKNILASYVDKLDKANAALGITGKKKNANPNPADLLDTFLKTNF